MVSQNYALTRTDRLSEPGLRPEQRKTPQGRDPPPGVTRFTIYLVLIGA